MRTLSLILCLLWGHTVFGLVKYDEGRIQIDGIQLLQDNSDPNLYYYIPRAPRLSTNDEGDLELLCIKYVGQEEASNGGIFHALIEFSLSQEELEALQIALQAELPGARIAGPVPLLQTMKDGEEGLAGFQVISSILRNTEDSIGNRLISSGHAPLLPGSKAAIAARLDQTEATLLWESFEGPTSDVSVSISGYYEAAVKSYNAVINVEMENVYTHYSKILNRQKDYDRSQIRKITDEFAKSGGFNTDVFSRSDMDNKDLENLLNIVTNKLIELMFDTKMGWSKMPEKIKINEKEIPGRQEAGGFIKFFSGAKDQKYVSDNQFSLKKITEINSNRFYLNLNKSTVIKVPIYTSGNLGGSFYKIHKDKYFRTVNLNDPAFQKRSIHFQVDGEFAESFGDILNFVSVDFKKEYTGDHAAVTDAITFQSSDLQESDGVKSISYPRLDEDENWLNYQYFVNWSMKGSDKTIRVPAYKNRWISVNEIAISLIPPFRKKIVELEVDPAAYEESGAKTVQIKFYVVLNGKAQVQRSVLMKASDAENIKKVALYYDEDRSGNPEPCYYQVVWFGSQFEEGKKVTQPLVVGDSKEEYLFITAPQ